MAQGLRIRIVKGNYRGMDGFHVLGPGHGIYQHRVFVLSRHAAELCRDAYRVGRNPTLDDMLGIEPLWWDSEAT